MISLLLLGPCMSIHVAKNDGDYLILNGTEVTRHITVEYSNSWAEPQSTGIRISDADTQLHLFLPSNHIHPSNCTWYGTTEGSITISSVGIINIIYEVVISDQIYRTVKTLQVIDISGKQ